MSKESPERKLDYGGAIQRLREEQGKTREALAEAAGISPSYLYEVERGLKRPSADVLAKLASAFGMLPSRVLEYIERQTPPPLPAIASSAYSLAVPESRRAWAGRPEPILADVAASPAPEAPTLRTLLSVARELGDDDLRVLLELARHLRAKRK